MSIFTIGLTVSTGLTDLVGDVVPDVEGVPASTNTPSRAPAPAQTWTSQRAQGANAGRAHNVSRQKRKTTKKQKNSTAPLPGWCFLAKNRLY